MRAASSSGEVMLRRHPSHPGKQTALPDRHDFQRIQHHGIAPSKTQFADSKPPATLFGLSEVFQRRFGLDPGLPVARPLKHPDSRFGHVMGVEQQTHLPWFHVVVRRVDNEDHGLKQSTPSLMPAALRRIG